MRHNYAGFWDQLRLTIAGTTTCYGPIECNGFLLYCSSVLVSSKPHAWVKYLVLCQYKSRGLSLFNHVRGSVPRLRIHVHISM